MVKNKIKAGSYREENKDKRPFFCQKLKTNLQFGTH